MSERKNFDEMVRTILPLVVENAPTTVSLGCAKEIAEDVAYLITRGYTVQMAKDPKVRAAEIASRRASDGR